ncbi:MAG: phosphotransferase [Gammaproteobacteria bacterium]|nr:phosphotransferase [Gammaproteobacteria bacterium]
MGSGLSDDKAERESALTAWAFDALLECGFEPPPEFSLRVASDDASFRRYFRGEAADRSFIFVDAPPAQEDSAPFVEISGLLRDAGINAAQVLAKDLGRGFMMLGDFGDRHYADALAMGDPARVEALYDDAIDTLVRMQGIRGDLPLYDEKRLRDEMSLFTRWFLPRQLGLELDAGELALIERVMERMVENATGQPQVFVHRDYHCRNLMIVERGNPGVIDFQDAVIGPVTYDLVSLLRDCYYRFDPDFIRRRVDEFRKACGQGKTPPEQFRQWFDWMGLQRHLKVAGIFSRLNLRDGKPRYLADIPLVVDYMVEVAGDYEELHEFRDWLRGRVVPYVTGLGEP